MAFNASIRYGGGWVCRPCQFGRGCEPGFHDLRFWNVRRIGDVSVKRALNRSIYSHPAPKKAVKNVRKTVKPRKIRPNPCTCNCKCDCSVTCAPCAKPEVRVPSAVPSAKRNVPEANRIRETCPWPQQLETEPAPSPEVSRAIQAEQTVRAMANL